MQPDSDRPVTDPQMSPSRPPARIEWERTQKMQSFSPREMMPIAETPRLMPTSYKKRVPQKALPKLTSKREIEYVRMFQEQFRRLCLTLFANGQSSIRSLGFTSSIGGEGKSFLATVAAQLLANDSLESVTLIECNWEHPTLHQTFGIPTTPGLAEWLRGNCDDSEVRYGVEDNLTVIPAGDGSQDAIKLLKRIQQYGLRKIFRQNELLIVDLPPVITSSYGSLAASLVDTVVVVVRSEVTPSRMLTETLEQLKDAPMHGIILNQGNSRIPRWIRQIL
jgi:protein-tyrosine kinase